MPPDTSEIACDILIVGAGIAGTAFAAAVRKRGYSVVQVEMAREPLDTARGDHLQCVVVELLDEWGLLPAVMAAGAEKRTGARYVRDTGEVLLHAPHAALQIPHPYYLYLNHERIAETFIAAAMENPDYTLFRPARARNFEMHENGAGIASLTVHLPDDAPAPPGFASGQDVVIRPRMVVGADGRGSRVREVMGFGALTHDYESPLVILFGPRLTSDPLNELKTFMGPKGSLSRIPRLGDQWKLGLPIAKADIAFWKTATLRMRQSAVAARAPELEGFACEVAGFYPVRLLSAEHWARGNTVLIGDACHAMHPARGQGLNVAIRCLARLVDLLPDAADMADADTVMKRLRAYDHGTKPAIDKLLADNHTRGEQMDSLDPTVIAASAAALRAINNDPERLRRYCLQSAGYADSLSALSG